MLSWNPKMQVLSIHSCRYSIFCNCFQAIPSSRKTAFYTGFFITRNLEEGRGKSLQRLKVFCLSFGFFAWVLAIFILRFCIFLLLEFSKCVPHFFDEQWKYFHVWKYFLIRIAFLGVPQKFIIQIWAIFFSFFKF